MLIGWIPARSGARGPADGGMHKGGAAPLVGGAARFWRRGGNPPAPAFPRRGKRERGRPNSLLPQAIACALCLNPRSPRSSASPYSHSKAGIPAFLGRAEEGGRVLQRVCGRLCRQEDVGFMHLSRHIVFEVALYRHLREKWAEKGAKELQRKTIRRWPNALPRVPRGLAIFFAVLLGLLATNPTSALLRARY